MKKQTIWSYLPILAGIGLGYILIKAPLDNPLGVVTVIGIFIVLFVGFIIVMLSKALPENVRLEPASKGDVSPEFLHLVQEFKNAGFHPAAESILLVNMQPPGLILPLYHPDVPVYAAVFQTSTIPSKTTCELVSFFENNSGGLNTVRMIEATSLPASPGSLRQVFKNATPKVMIERHRESLAYLETCGIRARSANASNFVRDFTASFARQRASFKKNPVKTAAIAIYRSTAKTSPHVGPIRQQSIAMEEIEKIKRGETVNVTYR